MAKHGVLPRWIVRNWSAIDSAGNFAVASATGGYLYMSVDACQTWNPLINQGVRDWSGVSASAFGRYITACVAGGYLYNSCDGGINWKAVDSVRSWSSVKVSSTGQFQAATVSGGAVYMSTDYGVTWTQKVINSQISWKDSNPGNVTSGANIGSSSGYGGAAPGLPPDNGGVIIPGPTTPPAIVVH